MSCQFKCIKLWVTLALGVMWSGLPLLALAQQYNPPRRGVPGRREGAGTRFPGDQCLSGQRPLIGLTPIDNFGTTTSNTPLLLWHVPQTKAASAEMRLVDREDNVLYTTTLPLSGTPGIVGIQVPANVTAQMQPSQDYQWQFSLTCAPNDPSKNPFVEGVVQRVPTDAALSQALKTATNPRDRASIYAKAGIWHDAVGTLATQRCLKPNDSALQSSWKTLLQSVNLESYAEATLLKCSEMKP